MTTGITIREASFTRPADTTAYAASDLVANSTTAASVVPLSFDLGEHESVFIRRVVIKKSGTGVTNAAFTVHLFKASPTTISNGDNGAFSVSGAADYLGAFDVTVDRAFTDGAFGVGTPKTGAEVSLVQPSTYVYALVMATAAYTPASGEVFTVKLEAHRY